VARRQSGRQATRRAESRLCQKTSKSLVRCLARGQFGCRPPEWAPPPDPFGQVRTVLYALMGISAWLLAVLRMAPGALAFVDIVMLWGLGAPAHWPAVWQLNPGIPEPVTPARRGSFQPGLLARVMATYRAVARHKRICARITAKRSPSLRNINPANMPSTRASPIFTAMRPLSAICAHIRMGNGEYLVGDCGNGSAGILEELSQSRP